MGGVLKHPLDAFDPVIQRANAQGWGNSQVLEKFGWDFELLAQLGGVAPDDVTAFGGMPAMLHLPLELQRASVDVDVFCPSKDRFEEIVRTIETELSRHDPSGRFFKFVAATSELQLPIPKVAYHVVFPSATGVSWLNPETKTYEPGTHVKLDALIAPPPARAIHQGAQVLPFAYTGPHPVVPLISTTAMKLLALASGEVGLPPHRITELVKHVYDVSHLLLGINTRESLVELIEATKDTLELENRWHQPKSDLPSCAVAIKTTLAMLEVTVIREKAENFADTYLRASPSAEEWALWARETRYLAYVACKKGSIDDYVETIRVDRRLLQRELAADVARALTADLRKELRKLDLASESPSDRFPVVLFLEIVFRRGYRAASACVAATLGPDWDK